MSTPMPKHHDPFKGKERGEERGDPESASLGRGTLKSAPTSSKQEVEEVSKAVCVQEAIETPFETPVEDDSDPTPFEEPKLDEFGTGQGV